VACKASLVTVFTKDKDSFLMALSTPTAPFFLYSVTGMRSSPLMLAPIVESPRNGDAPERSLKRGQFGRIRNNMD
jgi:hypothetical protein